MAALIITILVMGVSIIAIYEILEEKILHKNRRDWTMWNIKQESRRKRSA